MVGNNEQVKSNWGGKRKGAGRPVGTTKPFVRDKRISLRVSEGELYLLKEFEKIVKYGDRAKAEKFIEENKVMK